MKTSRNELSKDLLVSIFTSQGDLTEEERNEVWRVLISRPELRHHNYLKTSEEAENRESENLWRVLNKLPVEDLSNRTSIDDFTQYIGSDDFFRRIGLVDSEIPRARLKAQTLLKDLDQDA